MGAVPWFGLASATDCDNVVHATLATPKPPAENFCMRLARRTGLTLAAALAAAALPAQAAPLLVPHRAVYDLSLDRSTEESGIISAVGRLAYEFRGSACAGYTTDFRMVTQIETEEASRLSDVQSSSTESGDGKSFGFDVKSFFDQALDKEVKGVATLRDGDATVRLEKPEAREVELGPVQFPTQHTVEMIEKAEKGERFYQAMLFDASDDADKAPMTTVVIGSEQKPAGDDPELAAMGGLAADPYWPVELAYFDLSDGDGEETPGYRISFKLHANGVTRSLAMDYGSFSLTGRLVKLDLLGGASDGCSQ